MPLIDVVLLKSEIRFARSGDQEEYLRLMNVLRKIRKLPDSCRRRHPDDHPYAIMVTEIMDIPEELLLEMGEEIANEVIVKEG